jgi:ankyrin repeat protein
MTIEENLHLAILYGDIKKVVEIVNNTLNEDIKKVEEIVNCRNYFGETPFMVAVKLNKEEIISLFLTYRKNNKFEIKMDTKTYLEGKTALIYAAENNNKNLFEKLLESGAKIDVLDSKKRTVLMISSIYSKMEAIIVKKILNSEQEKFYETINYQDENGMTALMHCVNCKHVNKILLETLLEKGPNLDLKSKEDKKASDYCTEEIFNIYFK